MKFDTEFDFKVHFSSAKSNGSGSLEPNSTITISDILTVLGAVVTLVSLFASS